VIAIVLLTARRERRKIVREEIRRVMELSHRLRNSLKIISYARGSVPDPIHKEMMIDAVRSMDTALRQLFPALGVELRGQDRSDSIQFDAWK
jgi:two-component sensor histidine kinase